MKIRQLENAQYAGRRFTARYQTNGYYEITAAEGLSDHIRRLKAGRAFL